MPLAAEKRKSVSLRVWSHIKHGSEGKGRGRTMQEWEEEERVSPEQTELAAGVAAALRSRCFHSSQEWGILLEMIREREEADRCRSMADSVTLVQQEPADHCKAGP